MSKAQKKAWKKIDTTDVELGLKALQEKKTARSILKSKKDEELFEIDEIGHTKSRSQRKAATKAQAEQARVDAAKELARQQREAEKEKLAQMFRERYQESRKQQQDRKNQRLLKGEAHREKVVKARKEEHMYDMWGDERPSKKSSNSNSVKDEGVETTPVGAPVSAASARQAKAMAEFAKRRISRSEAKTKLLNRIHQGQTKRAPVIPQALSINPPTQDYEQALIMLAKKIKDKERAARYLDTVKDASAEQEAAELKKFYQEDYHPEGEKYVAPPLGRRLRHLTESQKRTRRMNIAKNRADARRKERVKALRPLNELSFKQMKQVLESTLGDLDKAELRKQLLRKHVAEFGKRVRTRTGAKEVVPHILLPDEMPTSLMDVAPAPLIETAFMDAVKSGKMSFSRKRVVRRADSLRKVQSKDEVLTEEDFANILKSKEEEAAKHPRKFKLDKKESARAFNFAMHKAQKNALRAETKARKAEEKALDALVGRLGTKRTRSSENGLGDGSDFIAVRNDSEESEELDESDMEFLGYDEDEDMEGSNDDSNEEEVEEDFDELEEDDEEDLMMFGSDGELDEEEEEQVEEADDDDDDEEEEEEEEEPVIPIKKGKNVQSVAAAKKPSAPLKRSSVW